MTLLYIVGSLLLAVLSGLVAVGVLAGEDEELGEVSEGYRRERGWGRR